MIDSSKCPSELKFLQPFLQKAEEMIQAGHPVVAYYCEFYAVSLALRSSNKRTPVIDAFLASLFDHLESQKETLSTYSTIQNLEQGAIYIREFAYRLFLLAEKQESSEETLKKSLQSYSASLSLLQVYRGVFLEDSSALQLTDDELQDELGQIDEKSKYAKWRIIEIRKQLMLNKTQPVVKSTESQSQLEFKTNASSSTLNQQPTTSPLISTTTSNSLNNNYTNISFTTTTTAAANNNNTNNSPTLLYDPKVLSECERQARHAISALNFDDIETAAQNLQTALDILKPLLNKKAA